MTKFIEDAVPALVENDEDILDDAHDADIAVNEDVA